MKPRITYANVAATLALFFALGGSAVAAKHYLINSTSQVKPSVLAKLKGKTGARGATGKEGPQGKKGLKARKGLKVRKGLKAKKGRKAPLVLSRPST
jgi:hypothetical protein